MNTSPLHHVVQFFEHLKVNDLQRLHEIYTHDALFKDPFNEVQGIEAIQRIFAHMFDSLHEPRFVITQQIAQIATDKKLPDQPNELQCFVTWDFLFNMQRFNPEVTHTIRGASHLVLREENGVWRIALHRDYWDAAEELYEKLPVIGSIMRLLKRRANS
jgi:ketosteroid isomerase-like protein